MLSTDGSQCTLFLIYQFIFKFPYVWSSMKVKFAYFVNTHHENMWNRDEIYGKNIRIVKVMCIGQTFK